jgi:hypothetical protein
VDIVNNAANMLLVEESTGAVILDGIEPGDKVRVIPAEQIEAKRKMEADTVVCNGGRRFVKTFPDMSAKLCERLSPNAVWMLHALTPYVGINSGIVRYRNGNVLKRSDIVKLCGSVLAERTADRAVSELCERGVLAKCTVQGKRAFIMNPYVMHNGSRANATLLGLFKDTEWTNFG